MELHKVSNITLSGYVLLDKHMLIIQLIEMEKLKSENLSMRKLLNQKQLE